GAEPARAGAPAAERGAAAPGRAGLPGGVRAPPGRADLHQPGRRNHGRPVGRRGAWNSQEGSNNREQLRHAHTSDPHAIRSGPPCGTPSLGTRRGDACFRVAEWDNRASVHFPETFAMPPTTRICPRGHRWEPPSPPEGFDPGSPLTCPVCGARVEGMAEAPLPATIPLPPPTGAFPGGEGGAASPGTPPPTSAGVQIRCPHCHSPLHLGDEKSDEVLCPGCGGSFRLREARHTDTTSPMKTLGRFQLLERVGLGGFGAVWRARDTSLDRIVALKIPHTGLLTEKEELERF